MSSYPVKIGEETVTLAWTQDIARRFPYRTSKIGGAPLGRDLVNPKKATAAVTAILWLVLPPEVAANYPTPEDLFLALDHEADAKAIHAALVGIVGDMNPTTEKKSSSKNSRSRGSNSA